MSEKIKVYTIDPDMDGFETLEQLTYEDVVEMGELQSTSPSFEDALSVLVWMLNEERINPETFIVVVNETTKEVITHQTH